MRDLNLSSKVVRVLLPLFLILLVPSGAAAEQAESPLVIGLIPELNVFEQRERFSPLAELLTERVGRPVNLTMISRYGSVIERLEQQQIDGAFLGSFTGLLASLQLEMEPVARPINVDGSSTYCGVLFVRENTGIEDVEGMRGTRLALVDRATTAGFLFPRAWIRSQGVEAMEGFFSEIQFWGSHDAALRAVTDGRADVGAAKNTVFDRELERHPQWKEQIRVLARSEKVPSNGLFLAKRVDPAVRSRVREVLLGLATDPEGKAVLQRLGFLGFVETDVEDYAPVSELAAEAGIDSSTYSYGDP